MEYVKKEVNTVKELGDVFAFISKIVIETKKAQKDGLQASDLVVILGNVTGELANAVAGIDKIKEELNQDPASFIMTALIGAGEVISALKQEV